MSDRTKLVWRAKIKKATMSQKFDDKGDVTSTLQLLCEGDMLPAEHVRELALLQKESIVTITIESTQLGFVWTAPAQKGETQNAEVSDQDPRGGRGAVQDAADDLGIV